MADALSCRKISVQLGALSLACRIDWDKLWKEVETNEELMVSKQTITTGQPLQLGYTIDNNRLLYKGGLVLN